MIDVPAIQEALRQQGVDGWLFFDHHERDPLAYRILGLALGRTVTRRWYYFIPANGDPIGLVHRIEAGMLDGAPGEKVVYSSWQGQMDGVRRILGPAKRIAMQYSPLCAIPYVSLVDGGTLELIRGCGVEVVTSADLVQLFEARWSAEQLEMHLEAGRRVDRVRAAAFDRIGEALRSGQTITEWDVNRFIRRGFEEAGMVTDHGPIVAVNANMSNPHYEPQGAGNSPIRKGDAVLIDLWAKLDMRGATYYDVTWTGFCGQDPPAELVKIFNIVAGARDRAVDKVKAAVAASQTLQGWEVDDAARGYIQQNGYGDYFVHRTGHSIGEEVHGTGANMDNLETHDERTIIAGTCFSVEPGIYLRDFGIRAEVNVFVGEKEARVTGEIQRNLIAIV